MEVSLSYERIAVAEEAFNNYVFKNPIIDPEPWEIGKRASYPDRTLIRTVKLPYNNRTYYRVFSVVFEPESLIIENVYFGDMLP